MTDDKAFGPVVAETPPAHQRTTAELLAAAPIQIDRSGWARRGHAEFHPNLVLALEISDDLDDAAERLDEWALTTPGRITEVQLVKRRGKTVVYGRITP